MDWPGSLRNGADGGLLAAMATGSREDEMSEDRVWDKEGSQESVVSSNEVYKPTGRWFGITRQPWEICFNSFLRITSFRSFSGL